MVKFSCSEELSIDEVVERMVEVSPGTGERAALGEIGRHERVQQSKTGRQDVAVGFGKPQRAEDPLPSYLTGCLFDPFWRIRC